MVNKSNRIAVIVDSCSDVPDDLMAKYDMVLIPMTISFRDRVYQDRITISPEQFYQRLETEIPMTASPTGKVIDNAFDRVAASGYDHVIVVTISSALSGTNQEIRLIAQMHDELDVTVVDTKNIGIGSGLVAIYAAQLIEAGWEYSAILEELDRIIPQTHVFVYVPTLSYLAKGGRIGKMAGLAGSVLDIRPVISTDADGGFYSAAKGRGEKRTLKQMRQLVEDQIGSANRFNLAVADGANRPLATKIADQLVDQYPTAEHLYTGDISPALGVHTGPGLVGIVVQVLDEIGEE
ncbi:DegV family protein [Levilactobacillus bambusae]|uniref:DegV family protein n=1 Tax=Levilactobacillus bambusae TaxID=2024736 RepID=A0A2V1MYW5_9LACO|nr:DegV family protein [Levilactobacillus bambusae]PWG00201.1 DegV family protein [Levilactobacillus bambusae]